jgi:hypothetical protein
METVTLQLEIPRDQVPMLLEMMRGLMSALEAQAAGGEQMAPMNPDELALQQEMEQLRPI